MFRFLKSLVIFFFQWKIGGLQARNQPSLWKPQDHQIAKLCNSSSGNKPGAAPVLLNQISTGGALHVIPAWKPGSLLVPGDPGIWWRRDSLGRFCPHFARLSLRLSHNRWLPAADAHLLFPSSLCLPPVACCTLEKFKAAVKKGFTGSKALAEPVGSCYVFSRLGHTSVENKPCPLSVQTHRFMPDANLKWGPQKYQHRQWKAKSCPFPHRLPHGSRQNPFFHL